MRVVFSAEQAAASLWDYGEDELIVRALDLTDEELSQAWEIAGRYWDPSFPLPAMNQRVTLNHVNAFAVITLIEGNLRPLARERRRSQKDKPHQLLNPALPPAGHIL
jgi:hypothetical protein